MGLVHKFGHGIWGLSRSQVAARLELPGTLLNDVVSCFRSAMASSHQQQLATSKLLIFKEPTSRTLARLREKNREFSKSQEVLAGKTGISGVQRSRG